MNDLFVKRYLLELLLLLCPEYFNQLFEQLRLVGLSLGTEKREISVYNCVWIGQTAAQCC